MIVFIPIANTSRTFGVQETFKPKMDKSKKKVKKHVPHGVVHVMASFNNTIITITDPNGNALAASSCGGVGFKGSKKSTPFAAQTAAEKAARRIFVAVWQFIVPAH